jgi:hypothetical protein
MIVLSLDIALAFTGIAIIQEKPIKIIGYETFKTNVKLSEDDRLEELVNHLKAIVGCHNPKQILIEELDTRPYARNIRALRMYIRAHERALKTFSDLGLPLKQISIDRRRKTTKFPEYKLLIGKYITMPKRGLSEHILVALYQALKYCQTPEMVREKNDTRRSEKMSKIYNLDKDALFNLLISKDDEIARLKAELQESTEIGKGIVEVRDAVMMENHKLKAENERLRKAIEFYANSKNWENNVVDVGVGNLEESLSSEVARDYGRIAKQALAEVKDDSPKT